MSIIKDRVHGKCNSCPFSGELPDNKHRVVSVMIKNPPTERQQESKIQQKINSKMMIKEEGKIYEE